MLSPLFSGCGTLFKNPHEMRFARSWSRQTTSPKYMGYLQPATVSPVLAKNLVIESNGVDSIKAFSKKSGHLIWQLPLKNGVEGLYYEKAADSLFFGSNNGQFYNLNSDSGTVQWNFPLHSESTAPPLVQGNFIFHLAMNGTLYAFEKESGRVLWVKSRQPKDQLVVRGTTQPLFENGRVYVGYSDGYFIAYNAADGSAVWEKKLADSRKFNDVIARPGLTSKCILVANYSDALYCIDKTTGATLWQMNEGGSSQPIVVSGEDVLYSSLTDVMIIDVESGKIKKRFPMPKEQGIPTAVVPFKKWLIFGLSEGPLVLMERESGRWVDTFSPGRGITAPPTIDLESEDIYVVSNQANLYKLALKKRDRAREFLWANP